MTGQSEWLRLSGAKLTAQEAEIVQKAEVGAVFDGSHDMPPDGDVIIDGAFMAELLLGLIKGFAPHPTGVSLKNCRISNALILSGASTQKEQTDQAVLPFRCERVVFTDRIECNRVKAGSFLLSRCTLSLFSANSSMFSGPISFRDCCFVQLNENTDKRREPRLVPSIVLDSTDVRGYFEAQRLRTTVKGPDTDEWVDAKATLEIQAENSRFSAGVDIGLSVRTEEIGSTPPLDRSESFPYIFANFDNSDIFGDFRAVGAFFAAPQHEATRPAPESRRCLDLRGCCIRGDVELDHICATGQIRAEDAKFGQDVSIGGAQLVHLFKETRDEFTDSIHRPAGIVLEASRLSVSGSVHLVDRRNAYDRLIRERKKLDDDKESDKDEEVRDPRLLAIGQLRFSGADIGGDFDGSGATVCATGFFH